MKTAFLFPGQGSQSVGMGANLAAAFPESMVVFEQADINLDYKLDTLCFYGPDEQLSKTDVAQPALLTVSIAALRALTARGIYPQAVAGHSVGEYAALVAADVLDYETALHLVIQRGLAMNRASSQHPGAMAAVIGLPIADVAAICAAAAATSGGQVAVANDNGGGQIVISGDPSAVDEASSAARTQGAKRVIALNVSGAFHSPLMEPAAREMRTALENIAFRDAGIPIVANVTADYETSGAASRENLALQIEGTVRWADSMRRLLDDGFDTFVEVGSGSVLTGMMKRIAPGAATYAVNDSASLLACVAALGGAQDPDASATDQTRQEISRLEGTMNVQ